MKLFVDDERPAPQGWALALSAEAAIAFLERHADITHLSLDHDLGYTTDTIMRVLFWMRDNNWWPNELYVHTANEDGEEVMLGFIETHAPAGTLKGYGCNFWGTGSDSQVRHWIRGE